MIKIIYKFLIFLFFSLLLYVFLSNPKLIMSSVNYSISVFFSNVLPSLFPFFILADVLINYNYVYFLNKIFKFKYSYLIFLSLFSGMPSNSKYILGLLQNGEISIHDAEIMLSVTFFPNPMFVIGSIGVLMLGELELGVFILISVYMSNLIVYLFYYRRLLPGKINFAKDKKSFPSLIKDSVIGNSKTLLVILGTIVIFTTLSNIVFNYINVPEIVEAIFSGVFEMTSGVKKLSILLVSTQFKVIFISLILSFSGISILCQAVSILSDYKLDIKFILKNKLFIMILNFIINYIYIVFWIWIYFYSY